MTKNPLRAKIQANKLTLGIWVTLDCPNVTEAAIAMGLDWLLVDMEHGHLGWKEVTDHLRVISNSGAAGIVRIPELRRETIQRALDVGADENIEDILQVQGLEGIWFGPADMSASHGFLGQWEGGPVATSIEAMRAAAAKKGIASGVLARDSQERGRAASGIHRDDIALARLYSYAFRLHVIGAFHATRLALEQCPNGSAIVEIQVQRAVEALTDLANRGMDAVPVDERALISSFHFYSSLILRTIDALDAACQQGQSPYLKTVRDRFVEHMRAITSSNGIHLTSDTHAPQQARYCSRLGRLDGFKIQIQLIPSPTRTFRHESLQSTHLHR